MRISIAYIFCILFLCPQAYAQFEDSNFPSLIAGTFAAYAFINFADINGDGIDDFIGTPVTFAGGFKELSYHPMYGGELNFGEQNTILELEGANRVKDIHAVDLRLINKVDLIFIASESANESFTSRIGMIYDINESDISVEYLAEIQNEHFSEVTSMDLNGDQYPDVIVTWKNSSSDQNIKAVSFFLSDGQGKLLPQTCLKINNNTTGLAFADVNLDGHLDLLASNEAELKLTCFLNNESGSFSNSFDLNIEYQGWTGVEGIPYGDIDDDGDLDVIGRNNINNIVVHRNNGDWTFTDSSILHDSAEAHHETKPMLFDRDNDGDVDIVLKIDLPGFDDILQYYNNVGDGNFDLSQTLPAYFLGEPIAVDYDWDGDLDIFYTGNGSATLRWYENTLYNLNIVVNKNDLILAPNPSTGFTVLAAPYSSNWKFQIYSYDGIVVSASSFNGLLAELNVDFLNTGVYPIILHDSDGNIYKTKLSIID